MTTSPCPDQFEDLTDVEPLQAFREREQLEYDDAVGVLQKAIDVLSNYYVHLPLKRAMHGIDPVRRLRTIQYRLETPTSPQMRQIAVRRLVDQMVGVFVSLRDMHTGLVLPEPWRSRVAFLPFMVEEYWEHGTPHYVVSKVVHAQGEFRRGVEITEWNWIPIARGVELIADRNGGSNEAARHARGVDRLTYRWLGASAPPDEAKVNITFVLPDDPTKQEHEETFEWCVGVPPKSATSRKRDDKDEQLTPAAVLNAARDDYTEVGRRLRRAVYAGAPASGDEAPWFAWRDTSAKDALRWAILDDPDPQSTATYGYLRIHSFDVDPARAFVDEVERILTTPEMQETAGLVIDVRGNGGGTIDAGEQILQLLTPRRIQPEPLDFRSTPDTLALAGASRSRLKDWKDLIDEAIRTGAPLSRGLPVSDEEACNNRGQRYQAPVALIVDALSYSTTDIMAAGFEDHRIGPILGTSGQTGAGGANVWGAELVEAAVAGRDPAREPPLPDNQWGLRFALRCTRRVGSDAGRLLEDLGINVREPTPLTRDDVLHGNRDLLKTAIGKLNDPRIREVMPRARMTASVDHDGTFRVTTTANRIDVTLDDRPFDSEDVEPGVETVIPITRTWRKARLDGYLDDRLAVSVRLASPAHNGAGGT